MRNRQKGGLRAPAYPLATPNSLAACAAAFLEHLAVRAYSQGSLDAHRWSLKGFVEWADSQGLDTPAVFTRSTIESYQLHLFLRHRHPEDRNDQP
jgi:site-specific recombinase XerD